MDEDREPLVSLEFQPSARSLRGLGCAALALFGWLGYAAWDGPIAPHARVALHNVPSLACFAIAAVSGAGALWRPALNRPLYLVFHLATYPLAWLVAWGLLLLVFYGVLTPIALVRRALGQLRARRAPLPRGSAWQPARKERDKASYFRQF